MTTDAARLRAELVGGRWRLVDGDGLELVNDYLGYLADRGYSPRTERAYAFDLLHFARWLTGEAVAVGEVSTDTLLRYLTFCRTVVLPGRPGGNVVAIKDGRSAGYAPTTINRRLAAISGLFGYRCMRDPTAANPVPASRQARAAVAGQHSGLLGHLAKPKARSRLAGA